MPWSVVGRDAELAAVEEFLAVRDTEPAALVIVGGPGMGKTTVWAEAVRLARVRGAFVLVAQPTEAETKLSFAGLGDLLSGVPPAAFEALPEPQRHALDVALLRTEANRPPERRVLGTAVASLLRELAAGGQVVVAVDDAQWLDAPSSVVVEFALRRLRDVPVRVAFAVRTGTAPAVLGALPEEGLRRLELGPLSVAAFHRILSERLGRVFPRPTLVRITAVSAGSPLYALEIARLLEDAPGGPTLPIPASVLTLVRARIRSLSTESRAALLRVAAAARPDVTLVDPASLVEAEEADLITVADDGRIVFAHPLYASAVYSSSPLARKREAHRMLAELVGEPEERARHLALAATGPDDEVAAVVESAARRAHGRGAPDSAADMMELALQLTPVDGGTTQERRLELATYLELAGRFERATALLDEICADMPEGDLHARALLLLSGLVYRRAGESDASVVGRQALASARDPVLRARCWATLAGWIGTVDVAGAAAAAQAALDILDETDADPGVHAFALASLVRAELFLGNGFDRSAALHAHELERAAPPAAVDDRLAYKLGQWLRYVDDFDEARRWLAESEQAALDEGDESSLVNILLNRLILELWAGDWVTAEQLAERLSTVADQLGLAHAGAIWQAYLDAHLGRLDAVGE